MQATKEDIGKEQEQFAWKTQPAAARWERRTVEPVAARNPGIDKLTHQLRDFTGTRLADWIDHIASSDADSLGLIGELADIGYVQPGPTDEAAWRHPLGMFPPVVVNGGRTG